MKPHDLYSPDLPPPPFVPPFDPPGSQSPYIPEGSSTDEGSTDNDPTVESSSDDYADRPDWWPEDWPWPPEPEDPVIIETPPPTHTWPHLPPNHPYHVPPGYSAPNNLPPGHPGEHYPDMPPYTVVHPATSVNDDDATSRTSSN